MKVKSKKKGQPFRQTLHYVTVNTLINIYEDNLRVQVNYFCQAFPVRESV